MTELRHGIPALLREGPPACLPGAVEFWCFPIPNFQVLSWMLGTTSASFYQIPFLLLDLASPFLSLGIKGTTSDSRVVRTNFTITQRWGYQNITFFITLNLILTFNLSLHTHPLTHTECFLKCIRKDKEKIYMIKVKVSLPHRYFS